MKKHCAISTTYLVCVSEYETKVDFVRAQMHKRELMQLRMCSRVRIDTALTVCSLLPTPMTRTFPPNCIDWNKRRP